MVDGPRVSLVRDALSQYAPSGHWPAAPATSQGSVHKPSLPSMMQTPPTSQSLETWQVAPINVPLPPALLQAATSQTNRSEKLNAARLLGITQAPGKRSKNCRTSG